MKEDWKLARVNLDPSGTPPLDERHREVRQIAEAETERDLRKPIQQLVCDVHEEVGQGRSIDEDTMHAVKRMVSMMARVALSNDRTGTRLLFLNWVLVALTVVIAVLTALMLIRV